MNSREAENVVSEAALRLEGALNMSLACQPNAVDTFRVRINDAEDLPTQWE